VTIGTSAAGGEGVTATGAAKATAGGAAGAELTVQQILERHAAARGGAEVWHKIQTMAWTGHIESGRRHFQAPISADVPAAGSDTLSKFLGEGQRSVRVFDGTWLEAAADSQGTFEVKEYGAEEIEACRCGRRNISRNGCLKCRRAPTRCGRSRPSSGSCARPPPRRAPRHGAPRSAAP